MEHQASKRQRVEVAGTVSTDVILHELRKMGKAITVLQEGMTNVTTDMTNMKADMTNMKADMTNVKADIGTIKNMITHEEPPQPHHTARLSAMMKQGVPSWEPEAPDFHTFCEALASPCQDHEDCQDFEGHVVHVLNRDSMARLRRTILLDSGIKLPSVCKVFVEVACILPVLLEWITSLPPQPVQLQPQNLPPGSKPNVWVSDAVDDDRTFVFRAIAAYALAAIRFWWAQPDCKGVVVTGSPGIGKTWMGNYILWWFLQQTQARSTTIVYRSGKAQEVLMFDPSRLPEQMRLFNHVDPSLPLRASSNQAHQPNVIISDMYAKKSHKYIPSGRHGFEIVISSPNRDEFHDFGSSDGQYVWIPELSPSEASRALRCMRRNPQPCEQGRIADLLAVFGGRPRPVLQHLRTAGPQDAMEEEEKGEQESREGKETIDEQGMPSEAPQPSLEASSGISLTPTSYLDLENREAPWLAQRRNDIKMRAILHHGNLLALEHSLAARTASSDRSWSHKLVGYTPSPGLQHATIRWATQWVAWTTTQYLMSNNREQVLESLASMTDLVGSQSRLFGTVFEMAVHTLLQGGRLLHPFRQLLPGNPPRPQSGETLTQWPARNWREWRVDTPSAAINGDALLHHTCTYIVPAASNFPVVDGLLCLDAVHLQAFLGVPGTGGGVVGILITHAKQHAAKFETFVNFAVRHCLTDSGACVLTHLVFVVPEAQYQAYKYQAIPIPQDPEDTRHVPAAVMDALRRLRQWVLCVSFKGQHGGNSKPFVSRQGGI